MGSAAGALYGLFVFKYAEDYMHWVFTGFALLYLFGFSLMCWRVKEGEYPPPDDLGEKPSILKQAKIYIRECFGHPIYWLMFAYTGLQIAARSAGIGGLVFNKDALGISLQQMGMVGAVSGFISMGLQFPAGWMVDKFHPLRMTLWMQLIITPLQFVMYFLMVDFTSYVAFEGLKLVIFALYGAAGLPLLITIFPKDKYGQYCSCNGMIKSFAAMPAAFVGALFIDWVTNNGAIKDAYRWMFIWSGVFQALSALVLLAIYFMWKRHGGDAGYLPPGSALEKEKLAAAQAGPEAEPAPAS